MNNWYLVQAANCFKAGAVYQKPAEPTETDSKKPAELFTTIMINYDCSQATLDTVVKAIYAREIIVNATNAIEILSLGDYLQVGGIC